MAEHHRNWIMHFLIRLIAIPIAFVLFYQAIRGGKADPMGLALVYAFISVTLISFVYFGIESIVLYRRKLFSEFYCSIFLFSSAVVGVFVILSIL